MTEQQASTEKTSGEEQVQAASQQGTTDQQQTSEQTSEPTQSAEPKEVKDLPAWAQKQIREARKDAETYRKRIQEFEDAQKTEAEKLSDATKAAQARADAAEQRLREATGRTAIYDAATKANAISLNAVWAMAKDQLEYDDEGEPANVAEVIAALRKDEGQLFKHSGGRGDGGAGGTEQKREVRPGLDRLTVAYEERSKQAGRR